MTAPTVTVRDASAVLPAKGISSLVITVQRDGAAVNLTGKTVTATIRAERAPNTAVNAALEDHAVALTTPASGICTLTLTDAQMQMLSAPLKVEETRTYICQLYVVDDSYYPDPIRLFIRNELN